MVLEYEEGFVSGMLDTIWDITCYLDMVDAAGIELLMNRILQYDSAAYGGYENAVWTCCGKS